MKATNNLTLAERIDGIQLAIIEESNPDIINKLQDQLGGLLNSATDEDLFLI